MVQEIVGSSTQKTYARAWKLFRQYKSIYQGVLEIQLPASVDDIVEFVQLLKLSDYAHATISTYVCGIGYYHTVNGYPNPVEHEMVQKVLKSLKKRMQSKSVPRDPLTLPVLERLLSVLPHVLPDCYTFCLFRALFSVMFAGCMRVNELCFDVGAPENSLKFSNVVLMGGKAQITFTSYKHHLSSHTIVIEEKDFLPLQPVSDLRRYLQLRGNQPGLLMLDKDGEPIPRGWFVY